MPSHPKTRYSYTRSLKPMVSQPSNRSCTPKMLPEGCCLVTYSCNFNNSVTKGAPPNAAPAGPKRSSKQQRLQARTSVPSSWRTPNAGFVRIISASNLFGENQPPDLKILRVAVVPQDNRWGHIILNLSTEVADPKYADKWKAPHSKCSPDPESGKTTKSTRHSLPLQALVNDTTEPAEDSPVLKRLTLHSHPSSNSCLTPTAHGRLTGRKSTYPTVSGA
jgi:hypothetical protein